MLSPQDPYAEIPAASEAPPALEPVAVSYLEEAPLSRAIDPSSANSAAILLLLFTILSAVAWQNPENLLEATRSNVFTQGEWWRLLTSPFVHADIIHLLSNSMLFLVFATLLNNYFGRWAFPILSLVGAAATEALSLLTYPPDVRLVGASGMVYLMAGMWLVYFAKHSSYLQLSQRIMRAIAFILVVLVPTQIEPEVSYRTHAIGFGLGVFIAWMSLPWLAPKPLSTAEILRAERRIAQKKHWLKDDEDDYLTYLSQRPHPMRQSLQEDSEDRPNHDA